VNWSVANHGHERRPQQRLERPRIPVHRYAVLGNADDRVVSESIATSRRAGCRRDLHQQRLTSCCRRRPRRATSSSSSPTRGGEVFENASETNNVGQASAHALDVLPITLRRPAGRGRQSARKERRPPAASHCASSGKSPTTASASPTAGEWSDQLWLSRHADGSDVVASFGSARHIGQLAVGERYGRSLDVVLPEGISGNYYFNVRTGGPFEFIFGNNNTASSAAVPVSLSASPDLVVEKLRCRPPAMRVPR
jgi:hypothetical protein